MSGRRVTVEAVLSKVVPKQATPKRAMLRLPKNITDPPVGFERFLGRMNAALEQQARAIGQALHDEAGQILTAAHLSLAAAAEMSPAPTRRHLTDVKQHLDTLEQQLRQLAYKLRPRILDDLGLIPALRFLAESAARRGGRTVTLRPDIRRRLPATIETTVYRLIQEAMTNVNRHSGASRVDIDVAEQHGALRCRIADNGVGLQAARSSSVALGIAGIRDRLGALGGTLAVHSRPGQGTELVAIIPLEVDNVCSPAARRRSPDRQARVPRDSRTRGL